MSRKFTQTNTLELNPSSEGTVYLTVEHDLHPNISGVNLTVPDYVSDDSTSGFVQQGPHQWNWDGTTNEPWIKFLINVSRTETGNYQFVDTGSWAVVDIPPVNTSWRYSGSNIELESIYEVGKSDGITSPDGSLAYLGPHKVEKFKTGDQLFRLCIPQAASLTAALKDIQDSLGHVSRNLKVKSLNDEIIAIGAPSDVDWGWGGLQTGSNGFWAVDSARVSSPNNTWIHEYIHTRQDWARHNSTEWLIEGTTNYYAALYTFYQGRISFDSFHQHVATDRDEHSRLVDPSAWTSSNAHYTKGRRVNAALDGKIREETDGQNTFEDVFYRMNEIEGQLTHSTFEQIIIDIGGSDLKDWLDRYVVGSQQPKVSDKKSLYTPSEGIKESIKIGPGEETAPTDSCPICDTEVPTSDRFCPTCGTALFKECPICAHNVRDQEYCPECGTEIIQKCEVCGRRQHDNEKYCERCGTEY